jgi:predicted O-methyltransferase YrrM
MFRGYAGIESIVGLDNEEAFGGSQERALQNLRSVGCASAIDLPVGDRKFLESLPPGRTFDLVHIDGRHSAEDAAADILSAWPLLSPGGIMIADDTDFVPVIRTGIESASSTLSDVRDAFYFSTFRGWWVAKKR